MPSLTRFHIRFTPSVAMILITLIAVIFFARLGVWQLSRAHEKQVMQEKHAMFAKQSVKEWVPNEPLPLQYQQVRINGIFLPSIFLLDNQSRQHQFGYDILSPFLLQNGKVILIDRGFVVADVQRLIMPQIDIPYGSQSIQGSAYYPSEKHWLLGTAVEKKQANLMIVELIDTKEISKVLHKSVYPFIIRLDSKEKHGFTRDWPIVSMSPSRHYGYAMQWFAIAVVIFIIFIALNVKKL